VFAGAFGAPLARKLPIPFVDSVCGAVATGAWVALLKELVKTSAKLVPDAAVAALIALCAAAFPLGCAKFPEMLIASIASRTEPRDKHCTHAANTTRNHAGSARSNSLNSLLIPS
jgi:hypothetical protein